MHIKNEIYHSTLVGGRAALLVQKTARMGTNTGEFISGRARSSGNVH